MNLKSPTSPYRYQVLAKTNSPETRARFIDWMQTTHGPDLLRVSGCIEFRLFETGELELSCEYLFDSKKSLEQYLEERAPALRAKGRQEFSEEEVAFSRGESLLLTEMVG